MKIFQFKKEYSYTELILFGIKISHLTKNKYISLGTNCFPRMKLNQQKIKAHKHQGELSCPFDLCVTPLDSIKKILANNFEDYFQDLCFDEERQIWKNTKYNISYLHDKLNKEDFIKRYKQRIENFRHITRTRKNLVFVQALFNYQQKDRIESDLKEIYGSLKSYCKYNFKYKIINLIPNKIPSKVQKHICPNTYYFEFKSPYDEKWTQWWTEETDKQPDVKPLIKNCINAIYYK